MLFDLFKAFDKIESSHKSDFLPRKDQFFSNACATCPELPSNIRTMVDISNKKLYKRYYSLFIHIDILSMKVYTSISIPLLWCEYKQEKE